MFFDSICDALIIKDSSEIWVFLLKNKVIIWSSWYLLTFILCTFKNPNCLPCIYTKNEVASKNLIYWGERDQKNPIISHFDLNNLNYQERCNHYSLSISILPHSEANNRLTITSDQRAYICESRRRTFTILMFSLIVVDICGTTDRLKAQMGGGPCSVVIFFHQRHSVYTLFFTVYQFCSQVFSCRMQSATALVQQHWFSLYQWVYGTTIWLLSSYFICKTKLSIERHKKVFINS